MIAINKIAVLGPKGTFSDIAAKNLGYEILYFNTHEEVFDAINNKITDYALVAFENQLTGTIIENLNNIIKHDLRIIKEVILPIHHYLCVVPGAKEIKVIYSHPQGFLQCKEFLSKLKIKKVSTNSTVESFELIKIENKPGLACIGSRLAAKLYNLKIKNENIEDYHHNMTRFFVLSKKSINTKEVATGNKTSIIFTVKHEPGSLVSCLQRLAKHDINLTKIDSMPIPDKPWEYLFYCELETNDFEKLKTALDEMEVASSFIKILGSYPVIKESDTDGNN